MENCFRFSDPFRTKFLFSIQSSVCFYFFCFSAINIVNAFIYGAFRCQKRIQRGENYVSWFKVNKSSRLRAWCECMENVFTEKSVCLPFPTILLLISAVFYVISLFRSSFLFPLVCLSSVLDMTLEIFWINNMIFIADSENLQFSAAVWKWAFYVLY